MNFIDILIIILIVLTVARWSRNGLVHGVFSLFGLLAGLIVGALIAPYIMHYFGTPITRFLVAILVISVSAIGFDAAFEVAGIKLSTYIDKPWAVKTNAILGGIFGVVFTLFYVWLLAAILISSPSVAINQQIQGSGIIRFLDSRLPPAPALLGRINNLITPLEFPQVFAGAQPQLTEPVAPTGTADIQSAVKAAGKSTVRISSPGCGGVLYGSGFVVGQNLVMTNAHVVAGASNFVVEDTNGQHKATVVYFNPDLDVAVLRTNGLAGKILTIEDGILPRGTAAAVLGYPGGGNFKAVSASLLRSMDAVGLNIYGSSMAKRNIYEFQATVIPGNSGGPVVLPDGRVIGMVFASANNGQGIGYAITSPSLNEIINSVTNSYASVSTQVCAKN